MAINVMYGPVLDTFAIKKSIGTIGEIWLESMG